MTLAEKLDWLYKQTGFTYKEVEQQTKQAGRKVSESYQSKLRNGKKQEPGYHVLQALAGAFGIPVAFFYQEDIDEEYLAEIEAMLNDDNRATVSVALRSLDILDMNEEQREETTSFIERLLFNR